MLNYTIHDLPKIDRPREKLIKYGPEKLTDAELLAILLRTGKKGMSAVTLASKILMDFKDSQLSDLTYNQLNTVHGLGPAKSTEIVACFELSKRVLKGKQSKIYSTPKDVWNELKDIRSRKREHFVVIYLDSRNQEIKKEVISIGTLNASLVHPREVFECAVRNFAAHIMIAHNHPSNNKEPSEADVEITKRLVKSGEILGIGVIDHVIVTDREWYSFKENKLIATKS